MKDSEDYSLLSHNTFGMDVKCARFLEFYSVDELRAIISGMDKLPKPLLILGGGSNMLFIGDFTGTILHSGIKA